jgi:hypothetical protein
MQTAAMNPRMVRPKCAYRTNRASTGLRELWHRQLFMSRD